MRMHARFFRMSVLLGLAGASFATPVRAQSLFVHSRNCVACHNGLKTTAGEDVSIGLDWRPTMMGNSARDPYWLATVRREVLAHAPAQAAIEHECSRCHLPMASVQRYGRGQKGEVFAPLADREELALDGVACNLCHQILPDHFGERESFVGHFAIDMKTPMEQRQVFGPFDPDKGLPRVMQSASAFLPAKKDHLKRSEMCATCHTLFTHSLDAEGKVIGELPEQVPYLEWQHGQYRTQKSCQDCHMPRYPEAPIASVLGKARKPFARHRFLGGNVLIPRMLGRHSPDADLAANARDLDGVALGNHAHLGEKAARLEIVSAERSADVLELELAVSSLAGHKFPTAYPSRRAWLHLRIEDAAGKVVFESGALQPDGRIAGNDNDDDPARFEPHHQVIEHPDQVQIYEPILADAAGQVTTGLLHGVRYLKDNRLLPAGFDKATAPAEVAVHGGARDDPDFIAGSDRIRYRLRLAPADGPLRVQARLLFQPIGYRWARNLAQPDTEESARFAGWFDSMPKAAHALVAEARAVIHANAPPIAPPAATE